VHGTGPEPYCFRHRAASSPGRAAEFPSPAPKFRSASNRSPVAVDRDRRARQMPARLWAECCVIRRAPGARKKLASDRDLRSQSIVNGGLDESLLASWLVLRRWACAGDAEKWASDRYPGHDRSRPAGWTRMARPWAGSFRHRPGHENRCEQAPLAASIGSEETDRKYQNCTSSTQNCGKMSDQRLSSSEISSSSLCLFCPVGHLNHE
jgi:hypothetical protein